MANIKATSKSSNSNLKVPPLKIVLSSHQNNNSAIVNNMSNTSGNNGDEQAEPAQPTDKDYKVENENGNNANGSGGGAAAAGAGAGDTGTREPISSANQRITRSSQRAAQQNKSDNSGDNNGSAGGGGGGANGGGGSGVGDSNNALEVQDRTAESARKAKRRKGEPQESEQDGANQSGQQAPVMANICPADYQPPSQNSFELYRDIRERPYKKMLQLSHVQPKMPFGFKDYLINGGPYLLDGNRLGSGVNGAIANNNTNLQRVISKSPNSNPSSSRALQMRMKLTNLQHKLSSNHQASQLRHNAYVIPQHLEAPKSLRIGSPLYCLFQDQEKARHQMRMQHLKERERSVLTTEQEILRVYNRMAIAGNKQELHLSACTYFYYQERYHYLDETIESTEKKVDSIKTENEVPGNGNSLEEVKNGKEKSSPSPQSNGPALPAATEPANQDNCDSNIQQPASDTKDAFGSDDESRRGGASPAHSIGGSTLPMSEEELKVLNNSAFLDQLQEIDDKWAKIMGEMFIRHKNESDSLYAVQSLEWEWKAKEIGACDVRVSLKIEPDCVPRVGVSELDY